jgi:glycosyltransferase involved in cell wall biosynthesis
MRPVVAIDATLVGSERTGDATYWTCLVEAIGEIESEFDYLLLSNAPKPVDVPNLPGNFQWVSLKCAHPRWFSMVTMPLAARRLGAKAFHTQYSLSPLARNGITTIHDVSFFVGPEWFKPRDRAILRRFVPSSARRAKKVITVSESSKRDILRYIDVPANKIEVTPLAAPKIFKPAGQEAKKALDGLSIQLPYILSVSAQWPRKNFDLAYRAVELLPASVPHQFVVTGRFEWGARPKSARVKPTGFLPQSELPALYTFASLYLCTSHYEGFGIPILEAMACGVPVLTSAGGALREVAGDAAVVMDEMDAESWAAKITSLLDDSSMLDELRRRGFERASQFTWHETARRTLKAYSEVVQ